jgi:Zn finger protein HypA/HybF involved in hydrogenase expression
MIWESIKNIFKKKDNKKMEYDKIPFDSEEPDEMIDFKCKECGYQEPVPDFVAFECYTPEEFDKETGSPIVLCPKCDGDMIMKKA